MKYTEILNSNKELGKELETSNYNINILSNSTISLAKDILEYYLRVEGINANAKIGNYDNIVQDSANCGSSDAVIIFWDIFNITDDFYHKINLQSKNEVDEFFDKILYEFEIVTKNLKATSLVLLNKFTSYPFSLFQIRESNLEYLVSKLNSFIEQNIPSNFKLIDIEKIISHNGVDNSFDMRYFYSSKSLYTISFFKSYSKFVRPFLVSANGKSKKALILDCDNTLWKGVLGEDGFDSIEMSLASKDGAIFHEIQSIILSLNKKGILLGICSKNNESDVQEVIDSHPDMQLREKYITINKSNWNDKATNIIDISKELNIGLDSLVFLDDSPFEINLVRERLPEVHTLLRPDNLFDYPNMLRKNLDLFYNLSQTKEDKNKIKMYKQQVQREKLKNDSLDIDSYLKSLCLEMKIYENDDKTIPRLSQMTQKTNQFNLTTKRYTEKDMETFMSSESSKVFSFSVSDKFGDSGLTGLCIVTSEDNFSSCEIDTFLMSCRIIGRNLEYSFMKYLFDKLESEGTACIRSQFIMSSKNQQVKNFYDNCSFELIGEDETSKSYMLDINSNNLSKISYISIHSEN